MRDEKAGGYDVKLTPRVLRRREKIRGFEKDKAVVESKMHPEDRMLLDNILRTIDFDQIKNVFKDYLHKSGVKKSDINDSVLDEIYLTNDPKGIASYSSFLNNIAISADDEDFIKMKQVMRDTGVLPKVMRMRFELALIHELCHAFSRQRISSKDIKNAQSIRTDESGYVRDMSRIRQSMRPESIGSRREISFSFEALNEGVTERVAQEIYLEYGKRTGQSTETEQIVRGYNRGGSRKYDRYTLYVNQVDFMCEKIANFVNIPKGKVWESFKRGYFEKPELFHENTIALFKQTFNEGFLDEYAALSNQTPIEDLADFDFRHDISDPEEYQRKWLHHLGIQDQVL